MMHFHLRLSNGSTSAAAEFRVEIVFCEMSMHLMGIRRKEIIDYPNISIASVDNWFFHPGNRNQGAFHALDPFPVVQGRFAGQFVDVYPGAEGFAGAFQEHHANLLVGIHFDQRLIKLLSHLAVERIQLVAVLLSKHRQNGKDVGIRCTKVQFKEWLP